MKYKCEPLITFPGILLLMNLFHYFKSILIFSYFVYIYNVWWSYSPITLLHTLPPPAPVSFVCVYGGSILCRQPQKSCVHVYIGHLISRRQHVMLPPPSFGSHHLFSPSLWCSWNLEEAGRAGEGWSYVMQLSCLIWQSPMLSILTPYESRYQLSLTAKKIKK